ncbi:MAG: M43 family zinc metalloprotease [Bacteroidia bacterium]
MKKFYSLPILILLFVSAGKAQTGETLKYCGTPAIYEKLYRDNPKMKAEFEANELVLKNQDALDFMHGYRQMKTVSSAPTYIIPVVFHILHDYGPENISDAQVLDEVNILNRDYRKLNADTSVVDSVFKSIIADTKIEFRLAQIDPNGKCTNGIDRIASLQTYIGDDNSKLNPWPRNKYLNVWVVKTISNGAAGYAYLPSNFLSSTIDGILILSNYIGSTGTGSTVTSRALTHEIGHFFNLQHPWGNTNSPGVSCGDDAVSDTPITKGWTHCATASTAKICNTSIEENYQNYMDYSYCSRMFTLGQASRMTNALNSATAQRNQLWTASNLSATGVLNTPVLCAPVADFMPNTPIMLCAGASYQFNYLLMAGQPSSWSWQFPGGTPSSSTDSFPTIQYATPGTYSVTLSETNASGTNSITRTSHVIVSPTTTTYTSSSYSEGFENATALTSDWTMISPQGNAWQRTTSAFSSGAASLKQHNAASILGQTESAVGPSIDMTKIPSAAMTFRLAFAQQATTDKDNLRVYFSNDCGQTWQLRYNKLGTALATTSSLTGSFVPNSTQWRTETVGVSPYQSWTDMRFKFEIINGGGSDVFIDDINIYSSFAGIQEQALGLNNLMLYPNPADDHTTIAFSTEDAHHVAIHIQDIAGREVMKVCDQTLAAGEHSFRINTSVVLKPGIYITSIQINNQQVTRKLVVR